MKNIKESVWADIHRRSTGEQVKKEDEMTQKDLDDLDKYITHFANEVVYGQGMGEEAATLDNFCDHIRQDYDVKDSDKDKIIEYVKKVWFDELCDDVTGMIEQAQKEYNQDMYESVWSDIHKRSNGEQVRKEDNVNILDLEEFYEYIKKHYKTKVEYIDLDAMGGGNGDVLGVDITENIILFYKPQRGHILLSWSKVKIPMPFFDELTDRFKIENPNAMRRIITENDGSCTNKTFIDVIDFFLDHKESLINESVWADIHKRSNGEAVRKEDENLSDEDCDFLDDCLMEFASRVVWDGEKASREKLSNCIRKQSNTYKDIDVERVIKYVEEHWGEVSEELDGLIAQEEKEKRNGMYESVWKDMHQRSNGDQVRKEDDYLIDENELDKDSLICIKRYAILSVYYDKYDGKPETFLKCIENWDDNICIRAQLYDKRKGEYVDPVKVIPSFIKKNWETGKSYESYVNKKVSDVEDEIRKTGFIKKPGESINDTLSKWFDENSDLIAEEYDESIEEYVLTYYREGGSRIIEVGVDEWWDDLDYIDQIKIYQEYMKNTNESVWKDIHQRSTGERVRKEDELLDDKENQILKQTAKMFKNAVRVSKYKDDEEGYDYSDSKEDFIYYIEKRKREMFWTGVVKDVYDEIIDYVNKKWTDDCKGIDEFISEYIYECDGVPGGLTPADVGGMGAITFPGADGTPGSGDIPMPTGHVYQQVAPFGIFIRTKKGKKRKKKFRKEDEPCAHSPNAKVYDYVDDYREYVDRTYNNMDKRK